MSKSFPATFHGHKLVGPFPGNQQPANGAGLYARVSPKTGDLVLAHYNPTQGWSKYATTPERAKELAGSRSKKSGLQWFGFAVNA